MIAIKAYTATDLFLQLGKAALTDSVEVERRGGMVKELQGPTTFCVEDPLQYMALNPRRRLNPWSTLAEFPWLMCGRSDVHWLTPYIPGAVNFSDDGMVWRAGYGPRMRRWQRVIQGGSVTIDQVQHVISQLRESPFTRQAIISMWDPALDTVPSSRDYPCTQTLHFMCSPDGTLDCYVHMRSNDMVWGMSGANVPNWCLLLQLVAACSGLDVGMYYHMADNLHVYERHYAMLVQTDPCAVLVDELMSNVSARRSVPHMTPATLDFLPDAMHAVEHYRQRYNMEIGVDTLAAHIGGHLPVDGYVVQWANFMLLWDLFNDTPRRRAVEKRAGPNPLLLRIDQALASVSCRAWRLAAAAWLVRSKFGPNVEIGTQHMRDLLTTAGANLYIATMERSRDEA